MIIEVKFRGGTQVWTERYPGMASALRFAKKALWKDHFFDAFTERWDVVKGLDPIRASKHLTMVSVVCSNVSVAITRIQ